jgi:hypothetical protein
VTQTPMLDVTLSEPAGTVFEGANLYYREKDAELQEWLPLASTAVPRVRVPAAPSTGKYEIGVAPLRQGVEAAEDAWVVVPWEPAQQIADFDDPPAVGNSRAGQDGNQVLIQWDPVVVEHLDHYEVRYAGAAGTWNTSPLVARVKAPLTSLVTGVWWSGTQTYLIRAVTAHGKKSATDGTATLDVESESYEPIQGTVDEDGGGFTGTKTNTEVSGGALQIVELPATAGGWTNASSTYMQASYLRHMGSGTYVTAAVDAGVVVRERVEIQLVSAPEGGTITSEMADWPVREDGLDPGEAGIGDRITDDAYDLDGPGLVIEIDTAQDGVPTWDGWRRWVPGAVYKYQQVRLRFTLSSITPRNFEIATLKWRRRRLNRKDEQVATVVGTGGTTVTWTTPFTAAPKVVATVIANTDLHATIDTITATTCKVYVFNSLGVEQGSATVHVQALGV